MIGISLMVLTSSIIMQSLRKIVLCMPAVGAKIWCFFLSRSYPARSAFEECIVWTILAAHFMDVFLCGVNIIPERNALWDALHSSHFCC